jgi:hypothetical protein
MLPVCQLAKVGPNQTLHLDPNVVGRGQKKNPLAPQAVSPKQMRPERTVWLHFWVPMLKDEGAATRLESQVMETERGSGGCEDFQRL